MLEESIMYYEEFASCAEEQREFEMVVRGCNAAGYVYNITVGRCRVLHRPLTIKSSSKYVRLL